MLLPDHEIRRLCKQQQMVSPYNEELLNPASIDVTLGGYIMVELPETLELQRVCIEGYSQEEPYMVEPGAFFLAETREIFNLPDHVGAQFVLKSSRAREGFDHAEAGWCDPGWNGSRLTMEIKNNRQWHQLAIWPDMKFGQMKFILLSGMPERSYAVTGRYNGDLGVATSKG